jgi:hypothetical protein
MLMKLFRGGQGRGQRAFMVQEIIGKSVEQRENWHESFMGFLGAATSLFDDRNDSIVGGCLKIVERCEESH